MPEKCKVVCCPGYLKARCWSCGAWVCTYQHHRVRTISLCAHCFDVLTKTVHFEQAYRELAQAGKVDDPGGAEYTRVRALWFSFAAPPPLAKLVAEENRRIGSEVGGAPPGKDVTR